MTIDKKTGAHLDPALLKAEDKYRILVEQLPAITYLVRIDPSGHTGAASPTVYISPQVESILGYTPDEWLANPEKWIEHLHPDDRERTLKEVASCNLRRRDFTLEYRVHRKDGRQVWIFNTARYLEDAQGTLYTEGLMYDITARKRSDLRDRFLKDCTELFRRQADLSRMGEAFRTHIGQIIPLSSLLLALKDEPDGAVTFPIYFDADPSAPSTPVFARSAAEYVLDTGHPFQWADPAHRAALEKAGYSPLAPPGQDWIGVPLVQDGAPFGVLAVQTNKPGSRYVPEDLELLESITDHLARELIDLRRQEALQVAANQYRTLYQLLRLMCDNVPDMIWAKDRDHRYLFANRAICEQLLFAKDTDEPVGKTDEFFATREREKHPERDDWYTFGTLCKTSDDQALQSEHPIRLDEQGFVAGRPLCIDVVKAPMINEQGETIGTVGSARDVTRQREAEQEMEKIRRMETLGRLAGGIAHDFNNILQVINGLADLILSDIEPETALHQDLSDIRESGQRAAALTTQLLTFSQRQISHPHPLDLNTVIEETSRMLRRLIGEHIELNTLLQHDLPTVRADHSQLEQILLNLAANSRDAMPSGGWLRIETRQRDLHTGPMPVPGMVPGEYVEMRISDNGPGISPILRDRIFEPFYSTKEQSKGVGLGLATVYAIVRQNEGHIYLDEAAIGTSFVILLPVCEEPVVAPPAQPAIPPESAAPTHKTILLVEDEAAVRQLLARFLSHIGYRLIQASSGEDALKKLSTSPAVDMLITDVIMPDMNGFELARTLQKSHPRLPVLFVSGYAMDTLEDRTAGLAHFEFLPKPIRRNDLLAAVSRALAPKEV